MKNKTLMLLVLLIPFSFADVLTFQGEVGVFSGNITLNVSSTPNGTGQFYSQTFINSVQNGAWKMQPSIAGITNSSYYSFSINGNQYRWGDGTYWALVGSLAGSGGSGNVSVAGNDTQIQYNNNGVLGASPDLTWNDINKSFSAGVANVVGDHTSAIGSGNSVLAGFSFAGGFSNNMPLTNQTPSAKSQQNFVLGGANNVDGIGGAVIGYQNTVYTQSTGVSVIGRSNEATGFNLLVCGAQNYAENSTGSAYIGIGNIAMGTSSDNFVIGENNYIDTGIGGATVVGKSNTINAGNGATIGTGNSNNGVGCTTLGYNAECDGEGSVGIGYGAVATDLAGISIGGGAYSWSPGAVGIGKEVSCTGSSALCLGRGAYTGSDNDITIGQGSTASTAYGAAQLHVGAGTPTTTTEPNHFEIVGDDNADSNGYPLKLYVVDGFLSAGRGGVSGHATCWLDDGITLGHCESAVAGDGTCDCRQK